MKKRLKTIFSILTTLCVACSVASFSACGESKRESSVYRDVLINDYETPWEYSSMLMGNYLGVITENNDGRYITKGEKSAKVEVGNSKIFSGRPYVYQTFSHRFGDYTSFSVVKMLGVDVYNACAETKNLYVSLDYASGENAVTKYALPSEKWTTVYYTNYREYMTSDKCNGAYVYFDATEDGVNTFYLDNFRLYRTDSTYEKINPKLEENEICSFDRYEQIGLLTTVTDGGSIDTEMTSENTSTGKGNALKIYAGHGVAVYPQSYNYPGIGLSERILSLVQFKNYDSDDYLCFDFYSANAIKITDLFLVLTNDLGVRYFDYMFGGQVIPEKWTTIRIPVSEINGRLPIEEGFASTAKIEVLWGEFVGEDRVFYLDNFRMETGENK